MILVPVFMLVALLDIKYGNWIALGVFIIASTTDFIDGHIARKYNQITNFGKFMDPLADKLLVTAAMAVFVEWGQMPSWALMVVLAREFAVSGLRMIAASGGLVIAAAWSGKVKTVTTIIAICVMFTPLANIVIVGSFTINTLCVLAILATTIWSGAEYFAKNIKVLSYKD